MEGKPKYQQVKNKHAIIAVYELIAYEHCRQYSTQQHNRTEHIQPTYITTTHQKPLTNEALHVIHKRNITNQMHHTPTGIITLRRALGGQKPADKHTHAGAVGAEQLVVAALCVRSNAFNGTQPAARVGTCE